MKQVAAAIIVSRGKVLIARRKKGESREGFWEFPGGKIEQGETPQQCLEREIFEELGLEIQAGEILARGIDRSGHGSFLLLAIQSEILRGNIHMTVHDRVEWAAPDDLGNFELIPADRELWIKMKEHLHIGITI